MLDRRRRWARLLLLPALWSAVVTLSPAPIHACGGTAHAPQAAATAAHAAHAAHLGAAHEAPDAGHGEEREAHATCECVDCGAPAVATVMAAVELPAAAPVSWTAAGHWPAAARRLVARQAYALPFANGPPRR